MAVISDPGIVPEPVTEVTAGAEGGAPAVSATVQPELPKWYRLHREGVAIIRYLLDSEVHTFAFSVAANAILSFIPLVVMLYTLAWRVFHSQAMVGVVFDMVDYFLPSVTDTPHWVVTNIQIYANIASSHGIQAFSLIMILISCTGIFLPLEVALNQAWGVTKSRNYLMNQVVAFGLAILMVVLGMIAVLLSAGEKTILNFLFFHPAEGGILSRLASGISYAWLAVTGGAACIVFLFFVYWLLPNCKVPARPVMRASVVVGLVWLASRYVFVLVLPHLDLKSMYGPFYVSVGILFWAYISGLILFAGAQYSVKRLGTGK